MHEEFIVSHLELVTLCELVNNFSNTAKCLWVD